MGVYTLVRRRGAAQRRTERAHRLVPLVFFVFVHHGSFRGSRRASHAKKGQNRPRGDNSCGFKAQITTKKGQKGKNIVSRAVNYNYSALPDGDEAEEGDGSRQTCRFDYDNVVEEALHCNKKLIKIICEGVFWIARARPQCVLIQNENTGRIWCQNTQCEFAFRTLIISDSEPIRFVMLRLWIRLCLTTLSKA